MCFFHSSVENDCYDHLAATYFLLAERKLKKQKEKPIALNTVELMRVASSGMGMGTMLGYSPPSRNELPNMSTEAAQKTLIGVEKAVQKAEAAAKEA